MNTRGAGTAADEDSERDFEVVQLEAGFTDARGTITDILNGVHVQHIAVITSEAESVRGNHYHREATEYDFLLEGRMEVVLEDDRGTVRRTVGAGELVVRKPGVRHAMRFLEPSRMLTFSTRRRDEDEYETDTVRLERPLLTPDGDSS